MKARVSWWAIAARNLLKNARRSAFTALAIALGFAAVTTFGGFTRYIFRSLEEAQIYAQAEGHLRVTKPPYFLEPQAPPEERFLLEEELARIREVLTADPDVQIVTPQLAFRGILSNGRVSTVFVGVGRSWKDVEAIRAQAQGIIPRLRLFEGEPLRDDKSYAIGVGKVLSKRLQMPIGTSGIAVAPTLEGHINALDAEVVQITDAPSIWLEGVLLVAPLEFAQTLYDTTWVDRANILLRRGADLEATRTRLRAALHAAGLTSLHVATWRETSPLYEKTENMFTVIFLFVFAIILLISVLVVVNTTGMAVTERTREIGTLRALGIKRRGVIAIFARESVLLGLLGSAAGALLSVGIWAAIGRAGLIWTPPTLSRSIPLELELVPGYMLAALVGMVLVCLVAALVPAARAARMGIVDSLGHA